MTAARRKVGPVERSVKAFVKTLGALSARQSVLAADAVRLAVLLDAEPAGAAASALSRELRQAVGLLTPVQVQVVASRGEVNEDPVARLQDEVARKRRERRPTG